MQAGLAELPVAVDAMGGDRAPFEVVKGAIDSVRFDGGRVLLVGNTAQISKVILELKANDLLANAMLGIVHADSAIAMDEKPSAAMRKRDSSMKQACELVASKQACGALSAGNSGAMMAIGLLQVGRIEGVQRPAIAALMPSKKGLCVVIDVGANIECTPQMLLQFAIFGSAYVSGIFGIDKPRVGVLSNGEEASKGTELTRSALELIQNSELNCHGYCEGRDIFEGEIDVVVCDGFSGNVLLKTAEGTASYFSRLIKEKIEAGGLVAKLGALFMSGVFAEVKKHVDPREYGAAVLLGLKEPIFIAHGNSDAYAIRRAIDFVRKSHRGDVGPHIEESLRKIGMQT